MQNGAKIIVIQHRVTIMIRLGKNIRLTRREVERFTMITGFVPAHVRTFDDLDAYIGQCKRHYWGVSTDTKFLHWLIDRERSLCVGKG
ncbi:hypothetical protein ACHAC9_13535 [Massilia sp. CMS3.1]|uniref:hypothetical protein n=1 Tax=Massilia sp. CMS3.1 TaxID=3373083 RepID=UPI003EE52ED4